MRFTFACRAALALSFQRGCSCSPRTAARMNRPRPMRGCGRGHWSSFEARVDQFEIEVGNAAGRQLKRGAEPILRWSNPVREFINDGVSSCFPRASDRPRSSLCGSRSPEANLESGKSGAEFVSLSGEPLDCRREERVLWSPKTGGLVNQPLAEQAPSPADRPGSRLTQMRSLARRFQATNFKMDSPSELRLLTQPLHRYEDQAAGVLEGALFAFAEGNDRGMLLLLEAVADGEKDYIGVTRWPG